MANDDTLPGPPAGRPTELQQLEAALAAGVITPELFATLRAKLAPAEPAAAPPASRPAPAAPSQELPSLLEMFGSAPGPVVPTPSPPAVPAAPASPTRPPTTAADEAAARRRIEEHLARLRQEEQAAKLRQATAPVAPPAAVPAPPAPAFYPEPKPTPTFYPASPPAPPVAPAPAALPAAGPPAATPRRPAPEPVSRGRSLLPLLWVLLLAVGGGLAYYFTSTSHPDEELTTHQPAAPEPVPAAVPKPVKPKRTKAAKRAKTKKKAVKASVAVSEASGPDDLANDPSPTSVAAPVPAASVAEPTGRPLAAAAEAGDDAAATQVRNAMASYYADLNAPPLHASQHFAPQVERLYIRQNLTPEAIDAELARTFFPDNQHAVCQIEPGTLRVSSPAADGSRTATFTEVMRLYRVSLQKYQRLRTQVRVRFNAAYQIVYMRQEKLLANTFEE
ncbi:hypothetical protein [Hymenobacter cheonanensis]|uniref:hypothetical protein n=1 Tax=Hymenobacter sp. CA2-7 TaxID=3063993 RepID=UPI0027131631|nr:hypothetical protein [Hymenobacter sp. CA2-7]MDO7886123.1 hypothetical protein [Hymenobacter sp. CA2-7]